MGSVGGGDTAEFMRDRLLDDIRELKSLYGEYEDKKAIYKFNNLALETVKRGGVSKERIEKAFPGTNLENMAIDLKKSTADYSYPELGLEIEDLEKKIQSESDIKFVSIINHRYSARMDHFAGWEEAIGSYSVKDNGGFYQGDDFYINITTKIRLLRKNQTRINIYSESPYKLMDLVEKLVETRPV